MVGRALRCAPRAPEHVRIARFSAPFRGAQRSARPTFLSASDLGNTPSRRLLLFKRAAEPDNADIAAPLTRGEGLAAVSSIWLVRHYGKIVLEDAVKSAPSNRYLTASRIGRLVVMMEAVNGNV